jgi:hypothetical protein
MRCWGDLAFKRALASLLAAASLSLPALAASLDGLAVES